MTEGLHFHFSLSRIGEGNGNPLQCSYLENPRDEGACWAAIHGVAQSRTWLKRLSSSRKKNVLYFLTIKQETCNNPLDLAKGQDWRMLLCFHSLSIITYVNYLLGIECFRPSLPFFLNNSVPFWVSRWRKYYQMTNGCEGPLARLSNSPVIRSACGLWHFRVCIIPLITLKNTF